MKSGSIGIGVDAARADLAHQVHAHGIAAEREERAVPERKNAAIAPHQIERDGEDGVAEIFAEQRHDVGRHMQRRSVGGSSRLSSGTSTAKRQQHREEDRCRRGQGAR